MKNKFNFNDLMQFGLFLIALLTFIYLISHQYRIEKPPLKLWQVSGWCFLLLSQGKPLVGGCFLLCLHHNRFQKFYQVFSEHCFAFPLTSIYKNIYLQKIQCFSFYCAVYASAFLIIHHNRQFQNVGNCRFLLIHAFKPALLISTSAAKQLFCFIPCDIIA